LSGKSSTNYRTTPIQKSKEHAKIPVGLLLAFEPNGIHGKGQSIIACIKENVCEEANIGSMLLLLISEDGEY
jgi:hypothetical protein